MTHYDTLGVSPDAIPEVIRAAYKAMSQKYHPDLNAGDKHATARMQEINIAYAVLGTATERAKYDQTLRHKSQYARTEMPQDDTDDRNTYRAADTADNPSEAPQQGAVADEVPYFSFAEFGALIVFAVFTAYLLLFNPRADTTEETAFETSTPTTLSSPPAQSVLPAAATQPTESEPPTDSSVTPDNSSEADQTPPPPAVSEKPANTESPRDRRVLNAPNGAPWPVTSGYVSGYPSTDFGGSLVDLNNDRGNGAYFVKLIKVAQGMQTPSRYIYVEAGQAFTIVNVAPGRYLLEFQELMTGDSYRTNTFALTEGPSPTNPMELRYTTVHFQFSKSGNQYLGAEHVPADEVSQ